jgi:ABC-type branched-subunit amino acid transport system ATPase component
MLRLNNIEVIYSDVILVLRGVSLEVKDGQIVTVLGANGAGKTTILKAISGLLHTQQGKVTRGSIELHEEGYRLRPAEIVRCDCALEGQRPFRHLTVEENLLTGADPARRPGNSPGHRAHLHHFRAALRKRPAAVCRAGAADAGHRARADGPPEIDAVGRAVVGPRLLVEEISGGAQINQEEKGLTE